MFPFIASVLRRLHEGVRIVIPTFALAGLFLMSRTPDLWAMTDYNGNTNWLPIVVIGCLAATLVTLLRAR